MLEHITYRTQRKFYNKWLYKVTVRIPGISVIRYLDIEKLAKNNKQEINLGRLSAKYFKMHETQIRKLCKLLTTQKEYGKRIEGSSIDIYTNDENFYDLLSKEYDQKVIHRFEPDSNTIDMFDKNTEVVKNYPHGKYKVKVYLKPHKACYEDKISFMQWLENQKPKVKFSDRLHSWYVHSVSNWDRRYILADDEQTVLMMRLRSPNTIGKVIHYRLMDK